MVEYIKVEAIYSEYLEDEPDEPSDLNYKNLMKTKPLANNTKPAKKSQGNTNLIYCGLCPSTFGRQDHLKRHIECLHSSFTFCKCPVCGKQFTNESAVKRHAESSHSKNATYKCRVCAKVFTSFTKLFKHGTSHQGGGHKCTHCETIFKRRDHMLRHIKSQHLNQHKVCQHCGATLRRRDHLTKHLREKHAFVEQGLHGDNP